MCSVDRSQLEPILPLHPLCAADGFTSVAALRPWIDKTSQQLLAGRWTGDGEPCQPLTGSA